MNIREFKQYALNRLGTSAERPEIRFLVTALLEELAGVPRYGYHTMEDRVLNPAIEKTLTGAIDQAALGKPLQYILGFVRFAGCRIKVDERVLIPRPETEEMWHLATRFEGIVVDACTGSGCLAVAFKKKRPATAVYAFDVSEEALALATENAVGNGVDVRFFRADLNDLQAVREAAEKAGLKTRTAGLLISNPPYVREKEKTGMSVRVLSYEPHLALFVPDDDPLVYYRALARLGRVLLSREGTLLAEINESMGDELLSLMSREGYASVHIHKDMNEKNRFIEAGRVQ
ncbi:MAG: HemK/PrmC family methyltransferase [Bacteroidales bacterium]|mgnify:CR=1 FL=1|jgi:release factor glutamine methyltransferase|nr:peptide chain release factor N(5)-glutamine methyltransferase [Bacteroidales bacterium]MDD2824366.1 peptide chain release factor N(5)-glutamine methyltransferase [Bacteroidales bacterium]MDD3100872.1 peptide chain release factor N(5)-glutamine methyltransferase [Bacteroidales bacterium]MDD3639485.1 peptide chain release factor N(5)-glutamine methyltransferase [Bacteroidales bacterium]MDD3943740.1 peptide chain release factor N(5)-glutamine methyltransferase [Bacteroidales bacterium]